jgi:alpha-1,3-mannosyltransferase
VKIVQIVNHFHPCRGGKESIVKELSLNLKRRGHTVEVVCLNRCAGSSRRLPPREEWKGIKIHRVGFLNLHFLKIGAPPLGALRTADIVHVHGLCFLSDLLAITKFLYRKPLLLSTHGGVFHTTSLSTLKGIYFSGWLRLAGMAFDRVIAVSRNDFELFSGVFPKDKMLLVENAVDVKKFQAAKRKPRQDSFLFVGRLSKNKGLELLLDAFALLAARKKGATLTIAGEDFDGIMVELKKKRAALGLGEKVRFEGEVSEERLLELLSTHSFFVSASQFEGFGVSAIEAMASGLVPILNNIPTFRGFVKNGNNGFTVDFADAKKAAIAMEAACALSKGKLQEMSKSAKATAQRFSWESRVKEIEKIYKELKGI